MTNPFVELKDNLYRNKARLNFILKAFAAFATSSSDKKPNGWEAYHALHMAQETLNRMVQQTEKTLEQHFCQTDEEPLKQHLHQID